MGHVCVLLPSPVSFETTTLLLFTLQPKPVAVAQCFSSNLSNILNHYASKQQHFWLHCWEHKSPLSCDHYVSYTSWEHRALEKHIQYVQLFNTGSLENENDSKLGTAALFSVTDFGQGWISLTDHHLLMTSSLLLSSSFCNAVSISCVPVLLLYNHLINHADVSVL